MTFMADMTRSHRVLSCIILLVNSSRHGGNRKQLSTAFSIPLVVSERRPQAPHQTTSTPLVRLRDLTANQNSLPRLLSSVTPNMREEDSSISASSNNEQPRREEATTEELRTGWLHRTAPREPNARNSEKESIVVFKLRQDMIRKQRNHRIISPPTFYPSGEEQRAVMITEHVISVPLLTNKDDARFIDIFFTVTETIDSESDAHFFSKRLGNSKASAQERASDYVRHASLTDMDKGIVFLQGGPGFGAPPPIAGIGFTSKGSWAGAALSNGFKRIVLMDQRGTGRSSPITKQTLEVQFPGLFVLDNDTQVDIILSNKHPSLSELLDATREIHPGGIVDSLSTVLSKVVEYMSHFRADSIVKDAETIKDALLSSPAHADEVRPWGAVLGQSFGGFCIMTYLSTIANPPKICLLTGGIAPMLTPLVDVYSSLWERVKQRNLAYYERYPSDIATVKRIVRVLSDRPAKLPSGGNLTARRFLQLGMIFLGSSPSSFAMLHNLLAIAFIGKDEEDDQVVVFSKKFLKNLDTMEPFDDNPIYFLLHESIYANGKSCSPTNWAAHTVYESMTKTPSEFSYKLTARMNNIDERPTMFFGEMVFPWMADGDYAELSGLGMKLLAHALARKDDWTQIYNAEQMKNVLANGDTKAAAAVYFDDLYVDFDACIKVTRRGGPLEKCKLYVTNEYQHSGLRDNGAEIFSKLLHMCRGSVGVPS